jgi:pyruvate dehydrogenase E1 component beta subunit
MRIDPTVFFMSTLIPPDLLDEFGPSRVRVIPISEPAVTGIAIGAAACGMRPIFFWNNSTFSYVAFDQLVNQAAKIRYMSGGQCSIPVVFHAPYCNGNRKAAQHSETAYAHFAHAGGLKVVVPSCAADGHGLMTTSIRDDNPVVFVYNEQLSGSFADTSELAPLDFGRAATRRRGDDVTLVAIGTMVDVALATAESLGEQGISVEVIDPRTIVPLDVETIRASVRRTGALAVIDESFPTCSIAAEVVTAVVESPDTFSQLRASPVRVCNLPVPMPFSPALEDAVRPAVERVRTAVQAMLAPGRVS